MSIKRLAALIKDKKKQNFLIYGFGQAFSLITPLLVVPHIMAVCGEEGLGKISYGFALSLFLILIVDYAFDIKGTKEVAESSGNPIKISQIFNLALLSKLYLFLIVCVLILPLIYLVPFLSGEKQLFFYSLTIVFAQVFTPAWFLQGLEDFKTVSILNVASRLLYLILIYFFISNENDYVLVNLLLGLSSLILNLVGLFLIIQKYNIKIVPPALHEVAAILKADFYFCLSQLVVSVKQQAPIVLTGYFLGDFAAGQYKLIEQIIMPFRTLIQAFLRYFYPAACYKVLNNTLEGFSFWKKYSQYNLLLVAAGSLIVLLFPTDILAYFNASQQTIANVSPILQIAVAIPFLMAISLPLEQLMFIMNKNKPYVRITMAGTLLCVVLIVPLLKTVGILGTVVSLLIAELFLIIFYFINSYLLLARKTKQ